jgi:hypothetical protein
MARCEEFAWWQLEFHRDENPPSRFDGLPNEIVEHIMMFLPPDDVISLGYAYKRMDEIIDNNNRLSLYKKSKKELLRAGCLSDEVREHIAHSKYLEQQLQTKFQVLRSVPDLMFSPPYAVRSDCYFRFYSNLQQRKVALLLDLAARFNVSWGSTGESKLILVQASNPDEAATFAAALSENSFDVHLSLGFISRQSWVEFHQKSTKFIVVVTKIGGNFLMTSFPLLVNFKPLQDVHAYLELHSMNPEVVYTYFDTNKKETFEVAGSILEHLEPHTKISGRSWDRTPKLQIHRSFYVARSKYNAGPVVRVFNTSGN